MLILGLILGLCIGAGLGILIYRSFYISKAIEEARRSEETRIQESVNQARHDMDIRLRATEMAERDKMQERLEHEYERASALVRSKQLELDAVQARHSECLDRLVAAHQELETYEAGLGRLFKIQLDRAKNSLALEAEKERLIYEGKLATFAHLEEAAAANLANLQNEVEELSAHCIALAAAYDRACSDAEVGYQMRLNDSAIHELKELWAAIRSLRLVNPQPLFKACFEMYLRGPLKEAFGNVETGGGIYRITDLVTGLAYVGKTTCFKDRWMTHVKRGSYYEDGTAAGSTLYGAMKEHGVWNFRFEVLEVVDDENKLSAYERKWIEELGTVAHGLNMKCG